MAKVHYRHPDPPPGPASVALCGWIDVPTTDDVERVGCQLCVRALAKGLHEAAQGPAGDDFAPTGPHPADPGARELSEADMRALEASLRGSVERGSYLWRSVREAIREWRVFRADGAGVGSTSAPARFERLPRGRTDPTRQTSAQVDRVHGVDSALAGAYRAPRAFAWTRCACGAAVVCEGHGRVIDDFDLSTEQQLGVLLWALEERVLREHGRPTLVSVSVESVQARALDAWGLRLSDRHVALIRDAGLRAVAAYLVDIGEMAPPPKRAGREDEVRDYDLKGWDEIEAHTSLSRKVLARLSDPERSDDPLPIKTIPGVRGYYARKAELDAWFAKHAEQRGAGAA